MLQHIQTYDADADGSGTSVSTFYLHQCGPIALQFNSPTATYPSHRYFWNPAAIDQLLADETVTSSSAGTIKWPLADQVGTIRDIASHNSTTHATTIENHRVYDDFGNLQSESNAAVDLLFGFTGRFWDETAQLQNNLNRWYDPETQRWISEDPIGFTAGDSNLYRYVGNSPTNKTDPSGLEEVDLGWLSGWFDQQVKNHPNNPLIVIPAGTLVGPSALLDGTVFRGIHASACESRQKIKDSIATSNDPIQKGIGVIALGYGYAGEGFAIFGAAEGANAPISAGIGLAFPPLPPVAPPVNPIPGTLARVVPGHVNPTQLGVTPNVFVTNANALRGLTPAQIAQALEIPASPSFKIIEFSSEGVCGIATPIRSGLPGFVGRGVTSGGAPEFIIPNGPIPGGAVIRVVQ